MNIPSRDVFSEDTGLAAVLPSFGTIALISFVALALVGAPRIPRMSPKQDLGPVFDGFWWHKLRATPNIAMVKSMVKKTLVICLEFCMCDFTYRLLSISDLDGSKPVDWAFTPKQSGSGRQREWRYLQGVRKTVVSPSDHPSCCVKILGNLWGDLGRQTPILGMTYLSFKKIKKGGIPNLRGDFLNCQYLYHPLPNKCWEVIIATW